MLFKTSNKILYKLCKTLCKYGFFLIFFLILQGCSNYQHPLPNSKFSYHAINKTINFTENTNRVTDNNNLNITIPYIQHIQHLNKNSQTIKKIKKRLIAKNDIKDVYIYIEGDGRISYASDITPRNGIFKLYLQDERKNKIYIGRFGQYNTKAPYIYTHTKYRYSAALLQAKAQLIHNITDQKSNIHLIGFSGGGLFAYHLPLLLPDRNIKSIITIATPLDLDAFLYSQNQNSLINIKKQYNLQEHHSNQHSQHHLNQKHYSNHPSTQPKYHPNQNSSQQNHNKNLYMSQQKLHQQISQKNIPILNIYAEYDTLITQKITQSYYDLLTQYNIKYTHHTLSHPQISHKKPSHHDLSNKQIYHQIWTNSKTKYKQNSMHRINTTSNNTSNNSHNNIKKTPNKNRTPRSYKHQIQFITISNTNHYNILNNTQITNILTNFQEYNSINLYKCNSITRN